MQFVGPDEIIIFYDGVRKRKGKSSARLFFFNGTTNGLKMVQTVILFAQC